ncbi:MAG: heavy-metal-associated domain-containing protein [Candidatus Cloacimonadaceae bacterium]
MVTEKYTLENLGCADCAGKIEQQVNKLPHVSSAHLDFVKQTLTIEYEKSLPDEKAIRKIVKSIEPDIVVKQLRAGRRP